MANVFYTSALTRLLTGALGDLTSVTVKCAAVTSAYTPNLATDSTITQLGSAILESVTLTGVTAVNGVLDCNNITFTGTNAGTATQLVYYISTGTDSTSYLLVYDSDATNLPVTFNGSAVIATIASAGLINLTSS